MSNLVASPPRATKVLLCDTMTDGNVSLGSHTSDIGGAGYTGGLATGGMFKVNGKGYFATDWGTVETAFGPDLGVSDHFEIQAILERAVVASNRWGFSVRATSFPHGERISLFVDHVDSATVSIRLVQEGSQSGTVTLASGVAWGASDRFRLRMVVEGNTFACYKADADGANEVQLGTTQTLANSYNDSSHRRCGFLGRWRPGNAIDDLQVRLTRLEAGATTMDLWHPTAMSGSVTTGDWFYVIGETGAPRHIVSGGTYSVSGPYGALGYLVRDVAFTTALASVVPHGTEVNFAPVVGLTPPALTPSWVWRDPTMPAAASVAVADIDRAPCVPLALNEMTTTSDVAWATPALDGPVAPATLAVVYSPTTALLAGTHVATIQVVSAAGNNSPKALTATLTVTYPTLRCAALNPTALWDSVPGEEVTSVVEAVEGVEVINLTLSSGFPSWLTASLDDSTGPTLLRAHGDPEALAVADYTHTVQIGSDRIANGPLDVVITFSVLPVWVDNAAVPGADWVDDALAPGTVWEPV